MSSQSSVSEQGKRRPWKLGLLQDTQKQEAERMSNSEDVGVLSNPFNQRWVYIRTNWGGASDSENEKLYT